jgi:secondary thiamine-phosphate synthase enzyme
MQKLTIETHDTKEVIDITEEVNKVIGKKNFEAGVCHIFVMHTTAALSTADLDPGTDQDMLDAYTALIPKLNYRHPHNPANAADHILATLIGPSVNLPVQDGELVLGTWAESSSF